MQKKLISFLTAAGLALVVALPVQALGVGDKAPSFTATTMDGEAVDLVELIGHKPIYLKFWATWCRYCINELPHAQHIYDEYGEAITVLAINVGINDSRKAIREVYEEARVTVPTVFDEGSAITSQYKVIGTPNHVVIGRDGTITFRSFLASDELDQALLEAFNEAAGEKL
ncbi:TlpA disulfide reductase family protein [Marinimicrobium sp. ABcell2]|uniref:TlpA family protein disulfide reductase n=1 Tax=Marinimicrobium sp. ABcell2 TaxID=3069751 RepID=UPI0027B133A2|nr:TlpA disulfide reductase family protein [Marinimicrobium sp. ABcell2]MDQ2076881.1 TlpA disulfide reductase family protein [Marinimicrobium sp. ABcell2]